MWSARSHAVINQIKLSMTVFQCVSEKVGKQNKVKFILIAPAGNNGCCLSCVGCSCLVPVLNWYNYKASFSLSLCLLFFLHNHVILCVRSLSTTCVFFRQLVSSNKVWYYKMCQCDQYYDRLSISRERKELLFFKSSRYFWREIRSVQPHWLWKYWMTFWVRNWMVKLLEWN